MQEERPVARVDVTPEYIYHPVVALRVRLLVPQVSGAAAGWIRELSNGYQIRSMGRWVKLHYSSYCTYALTNKQRDVLADLRAYGLPAARSCDLLKGAFELLVYHKLCLITLPL